MGGVAFSSTGVVAFGVSTRFAYWGFGIVQNVVEAISGPTLSLHISSLQQLHEGFAKRDGASVVITADLPDADLAEFVCASGLPLIVFSDDVGALLDWTMESRAMELEGAARFCTRMYSALAPSLKALRRLAIAPDPSSTPESVVAAVIDFLWPGSQEWLAQRTFEHLVETGKIPRQRGDLIEIPKTDAAPPPPPDPAALQVWLSVLAAYSRQLEGKRLPEIEWPLSLFRRPDNRRWGDPIDLTGPARPVFFGPYIYLPVGEWTARVEFEIDGAVSGVEATTDVLVNEIVTQKTFAMPAKGIFAYELSFRVNDPHHAVEIRLFIRKSAIEGVFLPRSVRVRPAQQEEEAEAEPAAPSISRR